MLDNKTHFISYTKLWFKLHAKQYKKLIKQGTISLTNLEFIEKCQVAKSANNYFWKKSKCLTKNAFVPFETVSLSTLEKRYCVSESFHSIIYDLKFIWGLK